MKILKSKFGLALCLGMAALSCSATAAIAEDPTNQPKAVVKPVFDEKVASSYSLVAKHVSGDKRADKIFSKYHSKYLKYVGDINKEMDKYALKVREDISKEKEKLLKLLGEQQQLLKDNCVGEGVELTKNEAEQCTDIEKGNFEIEEYLKKLEVELKNYVGQYETDRLNRLNKVYVDFKNREGALKQQVEENNR